MPRFPARRRIPAQAFELKKYRCGIEPLSSTCDNEHTTAALGQSEILGIEDPPRDCARGSKSHTRVRPFSPWRNEGGVLSRKAREEAAEGVVADREDAGHVLPDDDAGRQSALGAAFIDGIGKPQEFEGEVSTGVVEGTAEARDRKSLAWRSAHQDVGPGDPVLVTQQREVAVQRHIRVMMGEHSAGEGLDLGEGQRPEAQRVPGDSRGFDP